MQVQRETSVSNIGWAGHGLEALETSGGGPSGRHHLQHSGLSCKPYSTIDAEFQAVSLYVASPDIAEFAWAAKVAELHAALPQAALAQAALPQAAEAQAAELHAALVDTALAQAAWSNDRAPVSGSVVTNASRFSFGFGGVEVRSAALPALTSPTPPACQSIVPRYVEVSMRAPLTSFGPQPGCLARICAAAPAAMGAENDVPDIHM